MGRHMIVPVEENGVVQWWDAARARLSEAPPLVQAILRDVLFDENCTGVIAEAPDVKAVWIWCASLPFWNSGPTYAPRPLGLRKVTS